MTDGSGDPVEGEVRLRIEGGFAHFPGLAGEKVVRFRDLPDDTRNALVRCAREACFFEQPDEEAAPVPDGRTYTVGLVIGALSHEVRITGPVRDPALARLVSMIRQLVR